MAYTKIPGNLIETGAITAAALDNDAVTTAKILDANITHAKLHTSMDLTGKTVTVATAAGSTNTTAAASTAFVQQELTTLIGGAPGTLDTLNELAAAINDDSNYNSTLTTALATKLPLAGGTMTGALTSNSLIKTTADLEVASAQPRIILDRGDGAYTWNIYNGNGSGNFPNSTFNIANNGGDAVLTALDNGNVGIGTTNPGTPLTISNLDNGTSFSSNRVLQLIGTSTTDGSRVSLAFSGNTNIGNGLAIIEAVNDDQSAGHTSLHMHTYNGSWNTENLVLKGGNVGIGNASPTSNLSIGSAQSDGLEFTYDGTNAYRNRIVNYWNSSTDTRMDFEIGRNGGVAPTPVMSVGYNGKVGIGTTTPDQPLHVMGTRPIRVERAGVGEFEISIDNTITGDTSDFVIEPVSGSNSAGFQVRTRNTAGTLIEALNVNHDGRLLVGKTAIDNTTVGFRFDGSSGFASFVRASEASLLLVRKSSDGDILQFKKDTATVGSIGTEGGNLTIDGNPATGKSGIEFSGAEWLPRDNGANSNGAISLGDNQNKFKDLYLSGSATISGSIGTTGIITSNHMLRSDAGHNTARVEVIYDDQASITTKGNMLMWASEPGITYDSGGIGTNIHAEGHYYGRKFDDGYGVYIRFEKQTGDTIFYNTQGTSGTAGGQGTERLRIEQNGELKPSNHIVMGLNKGINFAANANAAGVSAETLDDYEEGTWTPDLRNGTTSLSTQTWAYGPTAHYTKIGDLVFVHLSGKLSGVGGTSSGELRIFGLPFSGKATGGYQEYRMNFFLGMQPNAADSYQAFAFVRNNGTDFGTRLLQGGDNVFTSNRIDSDTFFTIFGSYKTTQ